MKYIDVEKLKSEITRIYNEHPVHISERYEDGFDDGYHGCCDEIVAVIDSLQQEQPKKRLIQVKCLYPYDESWQENKVYTCEVWHHGDLNRDFWDVYYDYGKDPRYVQFSSIRRLNEEFAIIQEESQVIPEQPEVDLEKEIDAYTTDQYHKTFDETGTLDEFDWEDIASVIEDTACHFCEYGMSVMRERITNPDYNKKVIEKIKSEYPMDESNARKEENK